MEEADEGRSEQGSQREEQCWAASRPGGRRRSTSIFPRRRKRKCLAAQRGLEESKETRGEERGRRLEKIIFLSLSRTHSLCLSLDPPLPHSLTRTHITHTTLSHTHLHSSLSMATKGAAKRREGAAKKKPNTTTTTNFKAAQ